MSVIATAFDVRPRPNRPAVKNGLLVIPAAEMTLRFAREGKETTDVFILALSIVLETVEDNRAFIHEEYTS